MKACSYIHMIICSYVLAGCGSTGLEEIAYPAYGQGVQPAPFRAGDWDVTLEVAQVGFGPAYFCATAAASADLCPAAVAELATTATVNALDPAAQPLGEVTGVTGTVRSATYDFAVAWLAGQAQPKALSGAPGGHSARFEGRASRGAVSFRFVADVDVLPPIEGSRAVQGARVTAEVRSSRARLDVSLHPDAWWAGVDFAELEAQGGDPVVVRPGSRAYSALVFGMTSTAAPRLEWRTEP